MARSCVCKICKAKGTTDTFFRAIDSSGKNKYYCSKEEYEKDFKEKQQRKELLEYIAIEVLEYEEGQIVNPVMVRKINELNKFYDLEVILKTFQESKESLQYWINNKNFSNEYGMVSYLMKIIEGNINDVYSKWQHEKKVREKQQYATVNVDIMNDLDTANYNNKKEDIMSFLDEEDV